MTKKNTEKKSIVHRARSIHNKANQQLLSWIHEAEVSLVLILAVVAVMTAWAFFVGWHIKELSNNYSSEYKIESVITDLEELNGHIKELRGGHIKELQWGHIKELQWHIKELEWNIKEL